MTMPHLMNCAHSEDGWCLECVKTLQRDQERIDFLATCNRGWPCVESIDHRHAGGSSDLYLHIAEAMPDDYEPNGKPVDAVHMQEAFRAMVDEAINESIAFDVMPIIQMGRRILSTGEVTPKREPASINAAFKCWWVNSGDFEPDGDSPHCGVFWEPLYVKLPTTAKPSCGMGNEIRFYDKTGNVLLEETVRHYGFMGPHPHLLNIRGMWREVVAGRVAHRKGLGWYMRWSVVTNSRFARMLNAAEGLIQS